MKLYSLPCLLALVLVLDVVSALYFHIGEGERKCFIEEIPDDTTVIGNQQFLLQIDFKTDTIPSVHEAYWLFFSVNYKVELYDPRSGGFMPSSPGIGMHVEVRGPEDNIVLSRVYSSEGMISFTSANPGEHSICMYSNSTSWFSGSQLRVSMKYFYFPRI